MLEQTAWINESAKALLFVVDEANPIPICSEDILNRDKIVYIHPNKIQAEEYHHLTLEQCNSIHEDLIKWYKSLAETEKMKEPCNCSFQNNEI